MLPDHARYRLHILNGIGPPPDVLTRHVLIGRAIEGLRIHVVADQVSLITGDARALEALVIVESRLRHHLLDALDQIRHLVGEGDSTGCHRRREYGDTIARSKPGLDEFLGCGFGVSQVGEGAADIVETKGDEARVRGRGSWDGASSGRRRWTAIKTAGG